MARKKIASNLTLNEAVVKQVVEAITDLLSTHAEEIEETINESDARKVKVNLGLDLDASESAPNIDVGIRFSSAVTDKRTIRCDDPNQMTFTTLTPEEVEAEKIKGKKAAKKNKDKAEQEANAGEAGE